MWDFIVKNWGPLYALASLVGLVVIILLSKTYAKREDLTALVQRVQRVEQVLADLPSERELHKLQLEISELRGGVAGGEAGAAPSPPPCRSAVGK